MASPALLETLLAAIVTERDDDKTEVLALGVVFARGTTTQYSDIDIAQLVAVLPQQANLASLANETMNLLHALMEIMAVHRSVLVQTNSTYWQQVQASIGEQSSWTCYHRLAADIDQGIAIAPPLTFRGLAVLHLFVASVTCLYASLLPHHREVVTTAAQVVREILTAHAAIL